MSSTGARSCLALALLLASATRIDAQQRLFPDSKSALISNDWVVGFNGTATIETWAFTLELYHESSHLGDEYEDRFYATRRDWTREVAVGWASYANGPWRLTGGLSYALATGSISSAPVARSG